MLSCTFTRSPVGASACPSEHGGMAYRTRRPLLPGVSAFRFGPGSPTLPTIPPALPFGAGNVNRFLACCTPVSPRFPKTHSFPRQSLRNGHARKTQAAASHPAHLTVRILIVERVDNAVQ